MDSNNFWPHRNQIKHLLKGERKVINVESRKFRQEQLRRVK